MKAPSKFLLAYLLAGSLGAQQLQDIPLLRPEERQTIDGEADEFSQALTPTLATAAKSTVRVWAGKRRLAYGTVVADGHKVLTKFSEVARAAGSLRVDNGDGEVRAAVIA